jgi:hypothetical protein
MFGKSIQHKKEIKKIKTILMPCRRLGDHRMAPAMKKPVLQSGTCATPTEKRRAGFYLFTNKNDMDFLTFHSRIIIRLSSPGPLKPLPFC